MLRWDPAVLGKSGIARVEKKKSFPLTSPNETGCSPDNEGDANCSAKQACIQRLSPPFKSKGQRLNMDSKCMLGRGKEHSNLRRENKIRGTARGTACVQSTSQIERSAKMVGLVSR